LVDGSVTVRATGQRGFDSLADLERRAPIGPRVARLAAGGLGSGFALLGPAAKGGGRNVRPLLQLGKALLEPLDSSLFLAEFALQLPVLGRLIVEPLLEAVQSLQDPGTAFTARDRFHARHSFARILPTRGGGSNLDVRMSVLPR
jgi:hypothetical protein